ncbi:MAG: flavodoxin [Thermoplasmata archaeon]
MRVLIVYYSLTGKTKLVAEAIAQTLGGDIRQIEEVSKRPAAPLLYLTGGISAAMGLKSKIKPINFDISDYDAIYLGTPIWGRKQVPAINAFISSVNFRNRNVILFATMGGDNYTVAIKTMTNKIEADGGKVLESFAIKTGDVKDEVIIEKAKELASKYLH